MRTYRAWRNRLTSEVGLINGNPVRVTRRRKKIIGIEMWTPHGSSSHAYTVLIDESVKNQSL